MKIQLSKAWPQKLAGRIERFQFEVGILEDKPHKNPLESSLFEPPKLTSYAGGPVQKQTREKGPLTTAQIFIENMKRLNINLLARPFQEESSDIIKFTHTFLRMVMTGKVTSLRRVENLLQAIVRNPILKQEYGKNKAATADAKGFDRHLFGTGQMFKAIKARVKRV